MGQGDQKPSYLRRGRSASIDYFHIEPVPALGNPKISVCHHAPRRFDGKFEPILIPEPKR